MHGLIFTGFRAFVPSEYPTVSAEILSDAPVFLSTEAYADSDFETLVDRTVQLSGDPRERVLRRFGIFSGISTFRLLYPDYYAGHDNVFSFLVDIEERIHEVVRKTIPQAAPPHLDIVSLQNGGVSITYTSPRQMCELLEGLVVGVARYYGDAITIEQPLCMKRGDDVGCTFFISRAG